MQGEWTVTVNHRIRVGITGASGLIGFHLKTYLAGNTDVVIKCAERNVFNDATAMDRFVSDLDVVVHLAYLNRGSDSEIAALNPSLARQLVDACERGGSVKQIVFSSSTHICFDTAYGESKRECAAIFRNWAAANSGVFSNLIFPHVFGEYGKPFSNSVVSTFCYQLANGEKPVIDQDGDLELVHAQDVAALIHQSILRQDNKDIVVSGLKIKVSEMLRRVSVMAASYAEGVIPDLRNSFSLQLFNVYRSFLFPLNYPLRLNLKKDGRGTLFEAVKSDNGGQTFVSTTKPGITRGNHFHYHKVERFLVVQGEAVIRLRKLFSSEVHEFHVCGEEPAYIDIPTLHAHNITNVGDGELLTIFWSHEIFDPENTDTFLEQV